ncbi:DNA polymerase Y family protein [Corynebacterium sp.]|uniref:Y-family DNA polymerase n=1 Tax=Corynebacterium sp. TaxID=1720 RepID=UPI0026DC4661|nr:DNA polymerase Y family protein [Corynebacterium sp.]MDO5077109.1 DNA polymerase Y family protein [Corynebacterium sp.]
MRCLVLWFPDWPVQVLRRALGAQPHDPIAIARAGEVWVCNQAARNVGVRRGMRVRHAQALCPRLQVAAEDQRRDSEEFEQIVVALDGLAAGVEVLRPGLVAVDACAAATYHGGEARAIELLVDAAAMCGVDSFAGVADEITTAMIAARVPALVSPKDSKTFLASQPVRILSAEDALDVDPHTVQTLIELGLRTLGQVADVGAHSMVSRFGAAGERVYRIAVADTQRRVAPPAPSAEFAVRYRPEEPIERVDAAAFLGRQLAHELHETLQHYGLACQRLCVRAELSNGDTVERVWRTWDTLSEEGMADRVRWQLDGWLRGGASIGEDGGIVALTLDPLEVGVPDTAGLWGDARPQEQARRVIERVQSTLGPDRVLQPFRTGGRGAVSRVAFAPYGEPTTCAPRWNGALLSPHPTRMLNTEATLFDAADAHVTLDDEALLTSPPTRLRLGGASHEITGWAGPWLDGSRARIQVLTSDNAYLLCWAAQAWRAEASYA